MNAHVIGGGEPPNYLFYIPAIFQIPYKNFQITMYF